MKNILCGIGLIASLWMSESYSAVQSGMPIEQNLIVKIIDTVSELQQILIQPHNTPKSEIQGKIEGNVNKLELYFNESQIFSNLSSNHNFVKYQFLQAMACNYDEISRLMQFYPGDSITVKQLPHWDSEFLQKLCGLGVKILPQGKDIDALLQEEVCWKCQKPNNNKEAVRIVCFNEGGDFVHIIGVPESDSRSNGEIQKKFEEDKFKGNNFKATSENHILLHYQREKTELEKIISNDNIEALRTVSSPRDFDFNSMVEYPDWRFRCTKVPLLALCIIYNSVKCFKYALINGADPFTFAIKEELGRQINVVKASDFVALNGPDSFRFARHIDEQKGKDPTNWTNTAFASAYWQNGVLSHWLNREYPQLQTKALLGAIAGGNYRPLIYWVSNYKNNINTIIPGMDKTPLIYAIVRDQPLMLSYLISNGANPDTPDTNGIFPLHYAAKLRAPLCLKILLNAGANFDAPDRNGQTPLHYASKGGNSINIGLLCKAGANPNIPDINAKMPLHLSVENDQGSAAEVLLRNGADKNAKDMHGRQPIHYAAESPACACLDLLIKFGANVNTPDNGGDTPLHHVVIEPKNGLERCQKLIDAGAEINSGNPLIHTFLDLYLDRELGANELDIFEFLIKHGVDINALDYSQETPLSRIAYFNDTKLMEILFSRDDVNLTIETEDGKVIDLANRGDYYNDEATALIKDYWAKHNK